MYHSTHDFKGNSTSQSNKTLVLVYFSYASKIVFQSDRSFCVYTFRLYAAIIVIPPIRIPRVPDTRSLRKSTFKNVFKRRLISIFPSLPLKCSVWDNVRTTSSDDETNTSGIFLLEIKYRYIKKNWHACFQWKPIIMVMKKQTGNTSFNRVLCALLFPMSKLLFSWEPKTWRQCRTTYMVVIIVLNRVDNFQNQRTDTRKVLIIIIGKKNG